MYSVELDPEAEIQLAALPRAALLSFAELMTFLSVSPWNGDPYNAQRPDANMRCQVFGPDGKGLVVYFVLEDQRRSILLRIYWSA